MYTSQNAYYRPCDLQKAEEFKKIEKGMEK